MERLLDFADGGPWVEPTQAPTIDNPGAAPDKTRHPRGQPRGERRAEMAPHTAPPMADRPNRDRGQTISIGSSTSRNPDLRDELNRRQDEDIRTRIERRRERHRRADRDIDLAEGCIALALEFRHFNWPKKFKIDVLRYDDTTNPRDFLQIYSLGAMVAGADEVMMANWFPLVLKGDAQTWLPNLPKCSIRSWRA